MNKYIALFRGINVGGNNILPMKDLKSAMIALDSDGTIENVQTYIQSGNVVFSTKQTGSTGQTDGTKQTDAELLSQQLGTLVLDKFGFQPKVMLMNEASYREKVALSPFDISEGKIVHLYFLSQAPEFPDTDTLNKLKKDNEQWQIKQDMFFLYAPDGIGRSKLAEKAEKCLGVAATARNGNTVLKLLAMLDK